MATHILNKTLRTTTFKAKCRFRGSCQSCMHTTSSSEEGGPLPIIVHRGYDKTIDDSNGQSKLNYFRGWAYQQVFLNRRIQYKRKSIGDDMNDNNTIFQDESHVNTDRILFFEHDHVYTLGRGANEKYLTFLNQHDRERLCRKNRSENNSRLYGDSIKQTMGLGERLALSVEDEVESIVEPLAVIGPNNTPIYRVERGGEVTYHGPGQLVCYPLLDLTNKPYKQDLHWYLTCIEEVIIQTLDEIGIDGNRDDINTGVWVGKKKIAAVGVSSSRWITTHGFSLNINPDLAYFDTSNIIPCGIEGRGVTSIAQVFGESNRGHEQVPLIDNIVDIVINKFQNVFGVEVQYGSALK